MAEIMKQYKLTHYLLYYLILFYFIYVFLYVYFFIYIFILFFYSLLSKKKYTIFMQWKEYEAYGKSWWDGYSKLLQRSKNWTFEWGLGFDWDSPTTVATSPSATGPHCSYASVKCRTNSSACCFTCLGSHSCPS